MERVRDRCRKEAGGSCRKRASEGGGAGRRLVAGVGRRPVAGAQTGWEHRVCAQATSRKEVAGGCEAEASGCALLSRGAIGGRPRGKGRRPKPCPLYPLKLKAVGLEARAWRLWRLRQRLSGAIM